MIKKPSLFVKFRKCPFFWKFHPLNFFLPLKGYITNFLPSYCQNLRLMDLSNDLGGIKDIADRCRMFIHSENSCKNLLAHDATFLLEKRIVQTCYSYKSLVKFVPLFVPGLCETPTDELTKFIRDFPTPVVVAMFLGSSAKKSSRHIPCSKSWMKGKCRCCAGFFGEYMGKCQNCRLYFCDYCSKTNSCSAGSAPKLNPCADFLVEDLLKIVTRQ